MDELFWAQIKTSSVEEFAILVLYLTSWVLVVWQCTRESWSEVVM